MNNSLLREKKQHTHPTLCAPEMHFGRQASQQVKHVFVEEGTMDCINSAQKCTTVNISPKAQLNNPNQLTKSLHSTKNRAKDNVIKPNQPKEI